MRKKEYELNRNNRNKTRKGRKELPLRIIPLGGAGEIGKNMTVIEYGDDMIVIDMGLMFPESGMPGIDYLIPDTRYLDENRDKLRAFFITHGHEDHIGASPYVLAKYHVPVYATRLTNALISIKLQEHMVEGADLRDIKEGDRINAGPFEVEALRVSHSIDDAVAFAIHTPVGTIVHTGDFKIDFTPIDGKRADLERFTELGKQGVLALLSDSTNAEHEGYTISEKKVGEALERYFTEAKGRVIVATFASNIHRLQQIIDICKKHGRKICFTGRSIIKVTTVAKELGYLSIPDKMVIEEDRLQDYRSSKVTIVATGSQGEPMSGLYKMAMGEHRSISITPKDLVILSSSSIPGNEKNIAHVINLIYRSGAKVINSEIAQVHVSGHAMKEELKLMLAMVKPKFFIPVHGEEKHLYAHAKLAEEMGVSSSNILLPKIGIPCEIMKGKLTYGATVDSGFIMIDGLGVGDVGARVLRERQALMENGVFIAVIPIMRSQRTLFAEPELTQKGFIFVKEAEDIMKEARKIVIKAVEDSSSLRNFSYANIKNRVKNDLSDFFREKIKRDPIIVPIIIEV
ncbi:MAG: ribonuclease J [Clostridia bacterium]|nr:ribonuclease J [Clostridia bacterium]